MPKSPQKFHRRLDQSLIDALNDLSNEKGGWWHTLLADKSAFIAIRDGYLNVYVAGGSIARIGWSMKRVTVKVHCEYLTLPVPGDRYVELNAAVPPRTRPMIGSLIDYTRDLDQIKKRVNLFTGMERQGENQLARRVPNVIDIEIAFSSEAQNEDNPELTHSEKRQIDLAFVRKSGMLTFAEIKLYENQELRAELLPPVCRQLKTYANLIAQQRTELLEAYEAVRMAYRSFKGPFFERRGVMFDKNLDLDPVPRLLIYGYDQQQEKDAKSLGLRIAHSMREQCGLPGFSDRHVLAKGNIESFTDGDFA